MKKFKIGCLGVIAFFFICVFAGAHSMNKTTPTSNSISTNTTQQSSIDTKDTNATQNSAPTETTVSNADSTQVKTQPIPETISQPKSEAVSQSKPQPKPEPKAESTHKETANSTQSNNNFGNNFNANGIVQGSNRHHAILHSTPSSSSSGYDLTPGTKVQILGELNEYYHVKLNNGDAGYVYAHYVK